MQWSICAPARPDTGSFWIVTDRNRGASLALFPSSLRQGRLDAPRITPSNRERRQEATPAHSNPVRSPLPDRSELNHRGRSGPSPAAGRRLGAAAAEVRTADTRRSKPDGPLSANSGRSCLHPLRPLWVRKQTLLCREPTDSSRPFGWVLSIGGNLSQAIGAPGDSNRPTPAADVSRIRVRSRTGSGHWPRLLSLTVIREFFSE